MFPQIINFTFPTLFPLLVALSLTFHLIAYYKKKRILKSDTEINEKVIINLNSLKSLGNTFLILSATAFVAFNMLHFKNLPLRSYGVFLALAFLTGIFFAQRRGPREGISEKHIADISLAIIISALIGSRVFFLIFEQPPSSLLEIFKAWQGGLVIYGGIIFAAVTSLIIIRKKKIGIGKVFDVFSPSIAFGIFIGRLGCFSAGCCYGTATNFFLGMKFPINAPVYEKLNSIINYKDKYQKAFDALPANLIADLKNGLAVHVHPSQLYSSLNGLILFFLLTLMYKKKKFDGEVFLWLVSYYSISRFLIELTRIDTPSNLIFGHFTAAQGTGIILLPVALAVILYKRLRKI
ncbi:MAG: prolipoprotein diacylglyceryl transferase [Spirochaetes bacterium]|nr:prolipoprotein diacylglyceryl transferase [Spirochaetota bacterium]